MARDMDELLSIQTHLSRRLAGTHVTRTLYAVDAEGGGRSSAIIRNMPANRSHGMATLTLWRSIPSLADPADKWPLLAPSRRLRTHVPRPQFGDEQTPRERWADDAG